MGSKVFIHACIHGAGQWGSNHGDILMPAKDIGCWGSY